MSSPWLARLHIQNAAWNIHTRYRKQSHKNRKCPHLDSQGYTYRMQPEIYTHVIENIHTRTESVLLVYHPLGIWDFTFSTLFEMRVPTYPTHTHTLWYTLHLFVIYIELFINKLAFIITLAGTRWFLTIVSPNYNFPHKCLMPNCNGDHWPKSSTRLIMFAILWNFGPPWSWDMKMNLELSTTF